MPYSVGPLEEERQVTEYIIEQNRETTFYVHHIYLYSK